MTVPSYPLIHTDRPDQLPDPQHTNGIVWLDLEIDPDSHRLIEGAVLSSNSVWRFDEAGLEHNRDALYSLLNRARLLGGHNIFEFDLPELCRLLAASSTDLQQWQNKCADTLYLHTLFSPHRPRYALAKLYRNHSQHNNPVQDCLESRSLWEYCNSLLPELPEPLYALFAALLPLNKLFPEQHAEPFNANNLINLLPEGNHHAFRQLLADSILTQADTPQSWQFLGLAVFTHWLHYFNHPQARRPVWLNRHAQHGTRFRQAENIFWQTDNWSDDFLNSECVALFPTFKDFKGLREGQLSIIRALLAHRDIPLGILPTGGGKSLTFQLPALLLSKYRRGLTVIVSPLKALIEDQVFNLRENTGLYAERIAYLASGQTELTQQEILDGVWQGRIDILYVSPERLRTRSMRQLLQNRPPAMWVLDEAHTLSQWGTDFRPDFLRIAEHIAACYGITLHHTPSQALFDIPQAAHLPAPPIIGLVTATASARVKNDLQRELTDKLSLLTGNLPLKQYGIPVEQLQVRRENIQLLFKRVSPRQRPALILEVLKQRQAEYATNCPQHAEQGVALVYIRSRKRCETFAATCRTEGFVAEAYHAGLPENSKHDILNRFKNHELNVVVCTNAFGMGIDKAGIHTVIHDGPPTNLESYIQETGRAARKSHEHGQAYLFWSDEDIEFLFSQERNNRIPNNKTLHDCWRVIRPILQKRAPNDQWFADNDLAGILHHDSTEMLTTQIRVALLALERHQLLVEKEQQPSYVGIKLLPNAVRPTDSTTASLYYQLHKLLQQSEQQQGFTFFHLPELALSLGLSVKTLLSQLRELVKAGYAQWQVQMRIRLRKKHDFIRQYHQRCRQRIQTLYSVFQSHEWEIPSENELLLNISVIDHHLAQQSGKTGFRKDFLPILSALGAVRYRSLNQHEMTLYSTEQANSYSKGWQGWLQLAEACLPECEQVADYLCRHIPDHTVRQDLHDFQLDKMADSLNLPPETVLARLESLQKLSLIDLSCTDSNAGSLFFISRSSRQNYQEQAYGYLKTHYQERCQRLHLLYRWLQYSDEQHPDMHAFSENERLQQQNQLLEDYFKKTLADVVYAYCPDPESTKLPYLKNYDRAILPKYFSDTQKAIICESGRAALVLAGPGAGKTATVVHRVAYLLMKQDILPEKILILAYNRLAVAELRQRLYALVGHYAYSVTVSTFHGLARQITGLDENDAPPNILQADARYQWLLEQAVFLLKNQENPQFYQYIMVDEFQDIDGTQYELIAQLANLQTQDDTTDNQKADFEQQGYLMAVGDDDQNLYAFRGASIKYIQQFAEHYHIGEQQHYFLTTNYRSRPNIVALANRYIQAALSDSDRLKKAEHSIRAHHTDNTAPVRYGLFRQTEGIDMAAWLAQDIKRLTAAHPSHSIAVLARSWREFNAVQHYLEQQHIRSQCRNQTDAQHPLHSLVGKALLAHLHSRPHQIINGKASDYLKQWRQDNGFNTLDKAWPALLYSVREMENASAAAIADTLEKSVYDHQNPVVLLSFHSAKGMEFDHVYLIDRLPSVAEDKDNDRIRPLYVALTRAKHTLTVLQKQGECDALLQRLLQDDTEAECVDIGAVLPPQYLQFHRFLTLKEVRLTPPDLVSEQGREIVYKTCQNGKWCQDADLFLKRIKHTENGFTAATRQKTTLVYFSKAFQDTIRQQGFSLEMMGLTTMYYRQTDLSWYRQYQYFGNEKGHFIVIPYVRFRIPFQL